MAIQTSTTAAASFVVPEKGKAAVIEEVEVPEPGPRELLVRLNATGICHSDIHMISGVAGPKMPDYGCRVAGHEGAGVVVEVGANIKDWDVGDRAGVKLIRDTCGGCEHCLDGRDNYCRASKRSGYDHPGTFQRYLTTPAKYTTRIPDGVSDYVAGPLMCAGLTAYGSLKNSGLEPGNWVIIAVEVPLAVVVDTGAEKRQLALECRAEAFVDFKTSSDVAGEIKEICDGVGAHGVVVTAPQSYRNAFSFVGHRTGAVIMFVGLSPEAITFGANPFQYAMNDLKIMGTLIGSQNDAREVLDFAKRGVLTDVSEVRILSALPRSLQDIRQGLVPGRVVIDFNQP